MPITKKIRDDGVYKDPITTYSGDDFFKHPAALGNCSTQGNFLDATESWAQSLIPALKVEAENAEGDKVTSTMRGIGECSYVPESFQHSAMVDLATLFGHITLARDARERADADLYAFHAYWAGRYAEKVMVRACSRNLQTGVNNQKGAKKRVVKKDKRHAGVLRIVKRILDNEAGARHKNGKPKASYLADRYDEMIDSGELPKGATRYEISRLRKNIIAPAIKNGALT
jgi:hypothetical protein